MTKATTVKKVKKATKVGEAPTEVNTKGINTPPETTEKVKKTKGGSIEPVVVELSRFAVDIKAISDKLCEILGKPTFIPDADPLKAITELKIGVNHIIDKEKLEVPAMTELTGSRIFREIKAIADVLNLVITAINSKKG